MVNNVGTSNYNERPGKNDLTSCGWHSPIWCLQHEGQLLHSDSILQVLISCSFIRFSTLWTRLPPGGRGTGPNPRQNTPWRQFKCSFKICFMSNSWHVDGKPSYCFSSASVVFWCQYMSANQNVMHRELGPTVTVRWEITCINAVLQLYQFISASGIKFFPKISCYPTFESRYVSFSIWIFWSLT